jgi:hypothetical protein
MDIFIVFKRRRDLLQGDTLAVLFYSRVRTFASRISSRFAGANVFSSSVLLLICTIANISPSWQSCDACICIRCVIECPSGAGEERREPVDGATLALDGVIQRLYHARHGWLFSEDANNLLNSGKLIILFVIDLHSCEPVSIRTSDSRGSALHNEFGPLANSFDEICIS